MTTYRVFVEQTGPRAWVEYIEAESPQEALSKVANDALEMEYLTAVPLPAEMQSECICSQEPVRFERVGTTWVCDQCIRVFIFPPDEIDWEAERKAESQEDDWDELPTFWRERGTEQEDNRLPFSDPYYEDDVTLELED